MYRWALDLLACPLTGSPLRLEDAVEDRGRIVGGVLVSQGGVRYPIVEGIPRFLVDFRDRAERDTVEAFGTEWTIFAEHDDFFTSPELFREFVPGLPEGAFEGRVVLDAGCGAGRWTQHLIRLGAGRVMALDFSRAVEVCARKTAAAPNVVVVQGSLLAPPVRAGSVDVVISIGVIHHLADPAAGLAALGRLLGPAGRLAFWVYGREGNELYLAVAGPIRRLTPRIPPRFLLGASRVLALPLFGYVRTVNRWVPLRPDGSPRLPMQAYLRLLARLSFRDLTSVVYDQLSPALARYYRREEVVSLVAAAGLELLDLRPRTHNSWCVLARPASAGAAAPGPGRG
ncbi:MAG: methyltransferase domain-containing protein [Deltaproteobacteria bacterium]|nr:methyltransferase domain-containing protein [Deltaproteobacteria bacterium]